MIREKVFYWSMAVGFSLCCWAVIVCVAVWVF